MDDGVLEAWPYELFTAGTLAFRRRIPMSWPRGVPISVYIGLAPIVARYILQLGGSHLRRLVDGMYWHTFFILPSLLHGGPVHSRSSLLCFGNMENTEDWLTLEKDVAGFAH